MGIFSRKRSVSPPRRQRADSEPRVDTSTLFSRNRTIQSGRLSGRYPDVVGESARTKTHHLVLTRRRLVGIFGVAIVALFGMYLLVSQFVTTPVISATDSSLQLDDTYQQTVEAYYGSRPLERFRFALNEEAFEQYVSLTHPEVAALQMNDSAKIGQAHIALTIRKPTAGWRTDGTQHYVDHTGVVFTRNYYKTPAVQIVDNSGLRNNGAEAVASQEFLSFVGQLVGLGDANHLIVTNVTIPSGAIRDVTVRFKGVSYPVTMTVGREAGEQFEDAKRTITWLRSKGKSVSYVDVRVSRKAFYK